jgi:hypothetical protein
MTINYTTLSEKNLSQGIDARSPENQVKEGFVKDLQNADIIENKLVKRTGYQGYSGNIPVRVSEVEYRPTDDKIIFTLDGSISLDKARSSPLAVYGTREDGSEFLPGVLSKYYPGFTVPLRSALEATPIFIDETSTPPKTITVPSDEIGIDSSDIFVEFVESTSSIDASFQKAIAQGIRVNASTYDVSVDYYIYQAGSGIVYFADKTPVTGSSYVHSVGLNYPEVPANTTTSISVPSSTHGLENYNIIGQVYEVDAEAISSVTSMSRIIPDSLTISSTGDVTVSIINSDSSAKYYKIVLSAGEIGNLASGVVAANSSNSITISNVESPWVFTGIYLEQTAGGTKELVVADSVEYDDVNSQLTLSFTNNASDARNFIIYYQYGTRVLNRLEVTDTSSFSAETDSAPQLTLWGLDHSEIYIINDKNQGHANHIDSYRRSGEQRLLTGLGGNLFSSKTYSEAAASYLYATLFPNLQARTDSNQILAPVFWETGELPERSGGYITTDISATNQVQVTRIEYIGDLLGNTRVYLNAPSIAAFTSTGATTTVDSVIKDRDILDLSNMSYSLHNGSFRVYSVESVSADELVLNIEIPDNAEDYDDAGLQGDAGIYTDRLSWLADPTFTAGDSLVGADLTLDVVYSNTDTVVSGVVTRMEVPAGLVFTAVRTSGLITSRNRSPFLAPSVANLVAGDMISYTGIDRLLRVKYVNTLDTVNINLVGDGTTTTVTLESGSTSNLSVGQQIQVVGSDDMNAIYTIQSIESETEFTILSSLDGSSSNGKLVGYTFEVDEALEWQDTSSDSNVFQVQRRWIPVEAPFHSYDMPADSYFSHFSAGGYTEQEPLRSVMVSDNMYFTNGLDEVRKFEGSSIYTAGLLDWQSGLFITLDTAASGKIVNDNPLVTVANSDRKDLGTGSIQFKVPLGEEGYFAVGDRLHLTATTGTGVYDVSKITTGATHGFITITAEVASISGTSYTLQSTDVYTYYYRLNLVDENSNIIASSATGSEDHKIELTGSAAVRHKLVGLPPIKDLDYNKIEVQIYRTKANQEAPFYLITTIPISFDQSKGYIEYTDTFSDEALKELDGPQTAYKGAELGINIKQPPRAKYLTSAGNRLVLGNILDYPEFDVQLIADSKIATTSINGTLFSFRRNSGSAGTTFQDLATYQIVDSLTAVTSIVPGTNLFTVNQTAHGLVAGDWVYLTYSSNTGSRDLKYSGWWQVATAVANSFTVTLSGASAAGSYPDRVAKATSPGRVPVFIPGTVSDGNMDMANGNSTYNIFDTGRYLSMAINSTMRQCSISGFKPWLFSRSGGDLAKSGNILIRKEFADLDGETMSLTLTYGSDITAFVNGVKATTAVANLSQNKSLPSRVLVSYPNYPEAFDAPFTVIDSNSNSAIDVNSSDGQEITGIIPFFGETAFGAAQQGGVIVVFKTNSIYLIDIAQKASGNNPVQRLESQGLGCTAPYSIAVTKDGIIFANESGIYALRKNLSIEYIGRFMERNWKDRISLDNLSKAQGHHFGIGRAYKLSVPIINTENDAGVIDNSEVYVYNHTSEQDSGFGAWGRYTNHPVTGWANLGQDAFFASSDGRVFSLRRTGGTDDYRDDSSPVDFQVQTRSWDFGAPGVRKVLDSVIIDYKSRKEDTTGTEVAFSLDLEEEYESVTTAKLNTENRNTGINDQIPRTIDTIRYKLGRRKGIYTSIEVSNSTLDEPIEVTGISFKVGGLQDKGILTAQQSKEKN